MVRKYGLKMISSRELTEWTCSICGVDFLSDEMEAQEAFSFSKTGGYSSIFGDMNEIYIDLCQHCFKEKLGEYCTIIYDWGDNE